MEKVEAPPRQEQRLRMSYEEFLAWADEDVHAEWVDGEAIVFMPPKDIHLIPGFWLWVNWRWAEELPDPLRTFAEIAGPSRVIEALREMTTSVEETP